MWGLFGSSDVDKRDEEKKEQLIWDLECKISDLEDDLSDAESEYRSSKDTIKHLSDNKMWERRIEHEKEGIKNLEWQIKYASPDRDTRKYEKEIDERMNQIERYKRLIRSEQDDLRREKSRLYDLERKVDKVKNELRETKRKLDQVKGGGW